MLGRVGEGSETCMGPSDTELWWLFCEPCEQHSPPSGLKAAVPLDGQNSRKVSVYIFLHPLTLVVRTDAWCCSWISGIHSSYVEALVANTSLICVGWDNLE